MSRRKQPPKDPFIVSRETCGDCVYFGFVTGDTGRMDCCDYTFKTRRLRPKDEPCCKCSVKIKKSEVAKGDGDNR